MNRPTVRKQTAAIKKPFLIKAILSLAIAYIFASLAIDTGSLWFYLFTIILIIYGFKQLTRTFKK